jgi:hypothetical protein
MNNEEKLGNLIRTYGEDNGGGTIKIGVPFKLEIDGRFCDEFEDLESEAPCIVDYLAIESDSTTPWFHMYSNFATHYPLASNDKYSIGVLGNKNIEKIIKQLEKKYSDKPISIEKRKEINRGLMLSFAGKKLSNLFVSEDQRKVNFIFFLDCLYSCQSINFEKQTNLPYKNFKEMGEYILKVCDNYSVCLSLKVLYPTYESMKSSGYLAYQSNSRYDKFRVIVAHIYDLIDKHIPDELFNQLLSVESIDKKQFDSCVKSKDELLKFVNNKVQSDV